MQLFIFILLIHFLADFGLQTHEQATMFYKGYRKSISITNYFNDSDIIKALKLLKEDIEKQSASDVSLLSHVGIQINNPYMCAEIKPYS